MLSLLTCRDAQRVETTSSIIIDRHGPILHVWTSLHCGIFARCTLPSPGSPRTCSADVEGLMRRSPAPWAVAMACAPTHYLDISIPISLSAGGPTRNTTLCISYRHRPRQRNRPPLHKRRVPNLLSRRPFTYCPAMQTRMRSRPHQKLFLPRVWPAARSFGF